ncbi:hypothetical protein E1B28_009933 [Marasmius oreades]|uniref:Uncharacterized protein n=1 Tax=Marasmius oreades TaxID=181124 RepID=A0A9P7RW24_9AGAR|nr:uncharacterized protein E1B28_009933 [Marasmius oreades]KAG7090851.1 hypothetical protein E1B28_009933 [Marasmius oreades]
MAHSHYQQYSPTSWGTNQFQFGAPPVPTFHPQSSWGGVDFYRAHAPSSDTSLFDHAWNRVRNYHDYDSLGVGVHEARHWHSRAYGGMGDLAQMLPQEIGHAAAYEAYRTWIHNTNMYEPLSGDRERQREGMIGLAVAEATRLLQFSPRGMDPYTRQEAAEAAAATASELYYWSRDRHEADFRGRSLRGSHRGSYDDDYDPYAYDTDIMSSRRGRSRSRYRSHSRSSSYRRSTGIPGSALSYGGYAGSHPNQYAMSSSPYVPTTTAPMVMGSSYYSNGYGSGYTVRPRSSSMGYNYYPQTQYVTSGGMVHVPSSHGSNQLVVYTKPRKKHSWYRSRSKHRRSRSRSWSR